MAAALPASCWSSRSASSLASGSGAIPSLVSPRGYRRRHRHPAGRYAGSPPGAGSRTRATATRRRRSIDRYLEPNGAARWLQARRDDGEVFRYFGYDLASLTIPDRSRDVRCRALSAGNGVRS